MTVPLADSSGNKTERLALTVREAAEALGVGRNAVYNAINRGDLRAVKFGGSLLVPRVELDRLLGVERAAPDVTTVATVLRELARALGG
jgi:excisionase family DNA binding protein